MPKLLRQPLQRPTPSRMGRRLMRAAVLVLLAVLSACQVVRTTPNPTSAEAQTEAAAQATRTPRPRGASTSTALPSPTPTRAITLAPSALRGQVVQFWHPYTGAAQVLLDKLTQEFNQTNRWGIRVENTSVPGFTVLEERLRQAVQAQAGDELPDVWPMSTSQALLLDANGEVITDLQPYVADAEYGLTAAEQADFLPALWAQDHIPALAVKGRSSPDGKRLGLPWVRTGMLLLYNRTWAQELGYPSPPLSSTGFRDQACATGKANRTDRDRQNDATGGWLVTGDPAELAGWIYAFGGDFNRPDGRGYQFDTPEARQAVEFIQALHRQGCAWAGAAAPAEAFTARQALFVAVSLSSLEELQSALADSSDEWLLLPFPAEQASGMPAVVAYGPSLVVAQSKPAPQLAAWLFVRWLASPESQARWAQLNHAFPTRLSALDHLQTTSSRDAGGQTWRLSLEYLPSLRPEPYYASWGTVRWSLGDALNQLMLPDMTVDKSLQVLQLLDELAAEVHVQVR